MHSNQYQINRQLFTLVLVVLLSIQLVGGDIPVSKAATPSGSATLTINGGGGSVMSGLDGIKLTFNVSP